MTLHFTCMLVITVWIDINSISTTHFILENYFASNPNQIICAVLFQFVFAISFWKCRGLTKIRPGDTESDVVK